MEIVKITEINIGDAGKIHSESWKESHKSFCSEEFVARHTEETQTEYIRSEITKGKDFYMLIDHMPVGIVSVCGSLIENLYTSSPQNSVKVTGQCFCIMYLNNATIIRVFGF